MLASVHSISMQFWDFAVHSSFEYCACCAPKWSRRRHLARIIMVHTADGLVTDLLLLLVSSVFSWLKRVCDEAKLITQFNSKLFWVSGKSECSKCTSFIHLLTDVEYTANTTWNPVSQNAYSFSENQIQKMKALWPIKTVGSI